MTLTDEEKRCKRKARAVLRYESIDWTKSNAEIAKNQGCRLSTIWHARKRLGIAKVNDKKREIVEVDAKLWNLTIAKVNNGVWNAALSDDETRIIQAIRKYPLQMKQFLNVFEELENKRNEQEAMYNDNRDEVMQMLGITHGRSEDNALKKGAAMAFLRANGWTHYGAQRAVGLTCKSAGMSIRSTKLHAERMKNNLYKVTFSEVQKKLGEWLRKKNKRTTKGD